MKKIGLIIFIFLAQFSLASCPMSFFKFLKVSQAKMIYTENLSVDEIFSRVVDSEYDELPLVTDAKEEVFSINPIKLFGKIAPKLRRRGFNVIGDVKEVPGRKMVHIFGSVAKVKVTITSDRFTGLLSKGQRSGIMRASFASSPKKADKPVTGAVPGAAIKLFSDGLPSKNIHSTASLDGAGRDASYFSSILSTTLDPPEKLVGKIADVIFGFSTKHPNSLKLNHLGSVNEAGETIENVVTPDWISFLPTQIARDHGDSTALDFRPSLSRIPEGTKVFAIYGYITKVDGSTEAVYMGHIETESRFIASRFGDEELHFRHEGAPPKKEK